MRVSISARRFNGPVSALIDRSGYPVDSVDSVFGFADYTPIYGGRPFWGPELDDGDLGWLYDNGKGFRIPVTNHHVSDEV